MNRVSVILWVVALAALLGGCQATVAGSGNPKDSGGRVEGEYLVHLDQGHEPQPVLERAFGSYGLKDANRLEVKGVIYRIRLSRDPGLETLKEQTKTHPGILQIQPNFKYSVPQPPGREELSPANREP